MERTGNPIDDASHLDAGNVTKAIPTLLSSFAGEPKPNSYIDEDEKEGGTYDGNNTGYLEILSSDDENPKGNSLGDEIIAPHVGMKFNDEKEVFEFYKNYAFQIGFPIRKRNSKKGDDGVVRYVTFTCSREGRRTSGMNAILKPQPTIQTGCKARLTACSELNGQWRINTVHLQHNHRTSPSKSRLYRCNREISSRVKRQLEINDIAGIPLHKSFNSAVVEAGGYDNMACVEKDCRNFINKVRRLQLGTGDAATIQAYFSKMQTTSPGFFFSIDLDDEARLKNVFWADNRCREACKEFGDVVTFDTTYLTNKYDMPFAPFVGVNHHGQSTLLGCGLVSNEDTMTFIWLFRTWLECMHGTAPRGIITDQDRAMQNAIEIVFPNTKHRCVFSNTKHRWCLWHIMKKLPEKFGNHRHKASITSTVHSLVYDVHGCDEFEQGWSRMLEEYELLEHAWLTGLYRERRRWVPCFLKTFFWAGMSTTQRSESINAFFDGYVNSKTSLKMFVEQYERALRSKVEKEFKADFKSFSQMLPCATKYAMEKQFQGVYTIAKFKEFQEQFTGKVYCEVLSAQESYVHTIYEVREDIILDECVIPKIFKVSFRKEDCEIQCNCHLFEFRGIVCKYTVTVLLQNQVQIVPDKYILTSWRRDVNRPYTRVPINYDGWIRTPDQVRYEQMCNACTKLADLVAHDEQRWKGIMDWIHGQTMDTSMLKSINVGSQCFGAENIVSGAILDPKYSKRKGAPKKLRRKGHFESSSKKSKTSTTNPKKSSTSRRSIDNASSSAHFQEVQTSTAVPDLPRHPVGTQESIVGMH